MWITTGYKAASEGRTASLRAVVRAMPCRWLATESGYNSSGFFWISVINKVLSPLVGHCPHALQVAMLTIDRIVKDSVIGY